MTFGNKKKNQTIEKKILGDEKNQKKKMTVNRFHRTRTKEKKLQYKKKNKMRKKKKRRPNP